MIEAIPKHKSGQKGNCTWQYTYVKSRREWHWRVTINVKPVVLEGYSNTELDAMREVKKHMELAR